jgi:sec-independent protein translocase protein TatA
MPNLGGPELIWLFLLLILLFGAKKLPELGSSVGRSIKNFKKGLAETQEDEAEESRAQASTSKPADQR